MSDYFRLQLRRLGRMISDWGVHPLLAIVGLVGLSAIAWKACLSDERFRYVLGGLAIYLPFIIRGKSRVDFLEANFSSSDFQKIRILENLLVACAPILILLLSQRFILAIGALAVVILSNFAPARSSSSPATPSPFTRWPFEFSRGFRKTWWLYLLAILILVMSIKVTNPNLGLFAVAIPSLMALSYYFEPEDSYYVWIHAMNPQRFLRYKIQIILSYSLLLGLPLLITYGYFFPEKLTTLLLLSISGILWTLTSLLAKYAHFPSEMNLLQGIAVLFTILFPPLALIVLPVLYFKAARNLKTYLP